MRNILFSREILGRGPGSGASLYDGIFWFPLVTHICNEAVNMVSSVGRRLDPPVGQGDDELPLDIALQGNIDITPPHNILHTPG